MVDIYRVSALFIMNSKNQVLIAQRSYKKKNWPWLWWPAVAWTVEKDESYEQNIYKEAMEEIWLQGYIFTKMKKHYVSATYPYFVQWFKLMVDLPIEYFIIEKEEVEAIQCVDRDELIHSTQKEPNRYTRSFLEKVQSTFSNK